MCNVVQYLWILLKVSGLKSNTFSFAPTSPRKEKKRKITPVHDTSMNVSPLSECLTRRIVSSLRIINIMLVKDDQPIQTEALDIFLIIPRGYENLTYCPLLVKLKLIWPS